MIDVIEEFWPEILGALGGFVVAMLMGCGLLISTISASATLGLGVLGRLYIKFK